MEKMDFNITQEPPTQAEIDAERVRLKNKIKIYRIKVLSASVLVILIMASIMLWVHISTDTSDIIGAGVIAAGLGAVSGIVGVVGAFIAIIFGIGTAIIGIVIAIVATGMAGAVGATVVSVAAIAAGIAVFRGLEPIENKISGLAVSDHYQGIKLLRNGDDPVAEYLVRVDKQNREVTELEYRELNFVAHQH